MYKNIKWAYGTRGYLTEEEHRRCNEIDHLVDKVNIRGNCFLQVEISIEGGNQFHIVDAEGNKHGRTAYMTPEQCNYALRGMLDYIEFFK